MLKMKANAKKNVVKIQASNTEKKIKHNLKN